MMLFLLNTPSNFGFFLLSLLIVAFLYSSVGHGGASGYLAVMALAGISPLAMKSSSLIMNLSVSLISFIGFYRAGYFNFKVFWPLAISSVPMAFIGGMMTLSDPNYKRILGLCLLISIIRLFYQFKEDEETIEYPSKTLPLLAGGAIGLLSGLIGIGGGIILSPLMLLLRWGTLKQTATISALFIFVNSLAGLLGQLQKGNLSLPTELGWAIVVTILGGLIGAYFGSKKLNLITLRYFLAICLCLASAKLFFV